MVTFVGLVLYFSVFFFPVIYLSLFTDYEIVFCGVILLGLGMIGGEILRLADV